MKNLLIEVCVGLFICFVAIPVLLVLAGCAWIGAGWVFRWVELVERYVTRKPLTGGGV